MASSYPKTDLKGVPGLHHVLHSSRLNMRRRLIPLIIPILLLGTLPVWAQDCDCLDAGNCPLPFGTNFSGQVCYDITDAFNNDLADPSQGVCGVQLTFTHPHIWDLELSLTSPDGTTVDLIGPNTNAFGTTNNVVWNILMIPCAGMAQPDEINNVTYEEVWTNNQVWPFAALFEGSYYPVGGNCLESFDSGPANGTWCLEINNAPSTFQGEILNFEVILCDNSGILCCEADGADISDYSPINICEGNDTLLLDYVEPDYGLIGPDPFSYGYTYLVSDNNGLILEVNDLPDLTAYPAGDYQVCGLSYRLDGLSQLPVPDGMLTVADVDDNLTGGAPGFCGEISNECIEITIYATPVPLNLIEVICQGDSVVVGDSVYYDSGNYQVDLVTPFACDSTVFLELTVLDPDTTELVETICFGDTFSVGDSTYTTSGMYSNLLTNQFGCDSLVLLELTELPLLEAFLVDTICQGESVMVGSSTYDTSGSYSEVLQSSEGCDSTVFLDLLVLDLSVSIPVVPLINCYQPTQVLTSDTTGSGNMSFLWETTDGLILSDITADTLVVGAGGTYTLTVMDAGCTAQADIFVQEDLVFPTAEPGSTDFITCAHDSIQLDGAGSTAGPSIAYEWFSFNGNILSGENTISPWVDQEGIYFLAVTDSTNGCADTNSVFILTDLTPPFVEAGPHDSTTCAEPIALLDGSASLGGSNLSYQWTDSLGNPLTFNANLEANTSNPGWYYLTVTNQNNGCSAIDSMEVVEQFIFPVAEAGIDDTLNCVDVVLELDGSASDQGIDYTYGWTGPPGGIMGADDVIDPTIGLPGTYYLTVTYLTTGCSMADSVEIIVDTLAPIAQTEEEIELNCATTSFTLGNTGNTSQGPIFSYQWLDADQMVLGSTLNFTVNSAGLYILVVTNTQNGCTAIDSTTVEVDQVYPVADAGVGGILTCDDPIFLLDGTGSSQSVFNNYSWEDENGLVVGNTLTLPVSFPGEYCLVIENGFNFCQDTACVTITQDASLPTVEAGADQELDCVTGQATLTGMTSGIGPDYAYLWSSLQGNIVGAADQLNAIVDAAGIYYFEVTDTINGCSVIDSVAVTIDTAACTPQAFAGPNGMVNCYTFPFDTLDASFGTSAGPNISYEWVTISGEITGPNNGLQVVVDTGTYVLIVTNTTFGFSDADTVQVIPDLMPPIADAGQPVALDCETINAGYQLDGTGSSSGAGILYEWSTGVGGAIINPTTTTPTINQSGIYDLLVTNALNGCFSVDAVLVTLNGTLPSVCLPDVVQIPCGDTSAVLMNTCGNPNYLYTWSVSNGLILGPADLDSVVVDPLMGAAELAVEVIDTTNSCIVQDTVEIFPATGCFPDCNIQVPDTLTCDQTNLTLDGTGSSIGPEFVYQWIVLTNGNLCGGANTLQACADAPGTYRLTVIDSNTNFSCNQDVVVLQDTLRPTVALSLADTLDCVVSSVEINSSILAGEGPYTYDWGTSLDESCIESDTTQETLLVSCPGSYILEVTDLSNGCVDTSQLEVVIDTIAPTVVLSVIGLLTCENPDTVLSAFGSSSGPNMQYSWLLDGLLLEQGINLQEITINEPGTYCLEIQNIQTGCLDSVCTVVSQDVDVPVADAGPDLALTCLDTLLTINGMGPIDPSLTILWTASNGGCILGPNDQYSIQTNCPGTYTLTILDPATGCSGSASMVVGENNSPPLANAGPDQSITCLDTLVTLDGSQSASGASITYEWTALLGNLVSGINTTTPTADSVGIYQLVVFDTQTGCSDTSFAFVNEVAEYPSVSILPPATFTCQNGEISLDGSGSSAGDTISFQWEVVASNGGFISGQNEPLAVVNGPGVFQLTVSNDSNGCSSSLEVEVPFDTLSPSALITLDSSPVLNCWQSVLTLDGAGSVPAGLLLFTWSTPNGSIVSGLNGSQVEVDAIGSYQLLVEDVDNGCQDSTSIAISEDFSAPIPVVDLPDFLTCELTQVSLDASASILPAEFSVLWSTAPSGTGNIDPVDSLLTSVDGPGVYTLLLTDLETGCSDSTTVEVEEDIEQPIVVASVSGALDCDELVVDLSAVGSSDGPLTVYQWSFGGVVVDSGLVVPVTEPGAYELVVFDGLNGCSDTASVNVEQLTAPIDFLYLQVRPPSCFGDANGRIVIDSVAGGTEPFLYSIADQPLAEYIWYDFLPTGVYSLYVEDINGCAYDTLVTLDPPEEVLVDLGPDQYIQLGETVDIQALLSQPLDSIATISWAPQPACLDCLEFTVAPTAQVTYRLTVENNFGCKSNDQVTIYVETELPVYMPTIFSPNGDGENDVFFVQSGPGVAEIEQFLIFDRWGNLVHERYNFLPNDPAFGWDGDFNRKPVNSHVFVWMMELRYQNGVRAVLRGDVTIVR